MTLYYGLYTAQGQDRLLGWRLQKPTDLSRVKSQITGVDFHSRMEMIERKLFAVRFLCLLFVYVTNKSRMSNLSQPLPQPILLV